MRVNRLAETRVCSVKSECMRFNFIFPLVFVFSMVGACVTRAAEIPTESSNPQASFTAGIDAYQKKDWVKARSAFLASLEGKPENATALYNLGLTENAAGHTGMALGLWRKALVTSPRFTPASNAIEFAQKKLDHPEIPHDVEAWESFRKVALAPYSIDTFLIATALFLMSGGWLFFGFLGARRSARLDEKPRPGLPYGPVVLLILFIICGSLSLCKGIDSQTIRGTILDKKIEALSSPDSTATPLFDLYEGLEVIVRIANGDWTQVTYPGGATGWIPKRAVLATNEPASAKVLPVSASASAPAPAAIVPPADKQADKNDEKTGDNTRVAK